MNTEKRKKAAGLYRRVKRLFRAKIAWNEWPLKVQLHTQIISLVLAFFVVNFTFLILTTWYQY